MEAAKRPLRLQKYIADCGITSRRKAEELIAQGRVEVNGEVVMELGTKVVPQEDAVAVDNQFIDHKAIEKLYLVMNKPRGFMTTLHDPEGRKTVMDLCQEVNERIYPVGRLDYLSEGLLILTNDGEMANFIMHPRHEVTKVYEVKVFGAINEYLLKSLRSGVQIDGRHVKPLSVRIVKQLPQKTWLEFRLGEGRNREIRRICEAVGITVDKLKRVAIENLSVEGIKPGSYRLVSKKQLLNALGYDENGKRLKNHTPYRSPKKTVKLHKKGVQPYAPPADNEGFKKLRRENYFDALKEIEERKKQEKSAALKHKLDEKEKAHQKRKRRKEARKDRSGDGSAPHAIILN